MTHPLSGTYTYRYDRDRRLNEVVLPSARTLTNVYANGVLDYTITPEGTIDYDYSCAGRMTGASRAGEAITLAYDGSLLTSDTRTGTLAQAIGSSPMNGKQPAANS